MFNSFFNILHDSVNFHVQTESFNNLEDYQRQKYERLKRSDQNMKLYFDNQSFVWLFSKEAVVDAVAS